MNIRRCCTNIYLNALIECGCWCGLMSRFVCSLMLVNGANVRVNAFIFVSNFPSLTLTLSRSRSRSRVKQMFALHTYIMVFYLHYWKCQRKCEYCITMHMVFVYLHFSFEQWLAKAFAWDEILHGRDAWGVKIAKSEGIRSSKRWNAENIKSQTHTQAELAHRRY